MRFLQFFHNIKMRSKLVFLFILTGLLPLLLLSYISLSKSTDAVESEVFSKNTLFLEVKRNTANSIRGEAESDWNMLATMQEVYSSMALADAKGADSSEWKDRLKEVRHFFEERVGPNYRYLDYFLTDLEGNVLFSLNSPFLEGVSLSNREYLQIALQGKKNWSDFFYSEHVNKSILVYAGPLLEEGTSGKIVGVFFFFLGQDQFQDVIHAYAKDLGETGDAYLVDAEGLLMINTLQGKFSKNAAMKEHITGEGMGLLAPEIRRGNTDFRYVGFWKGYTGKSVLGSMGVVQIGKSPLSEHADYIKRQRFPRMLER